MPDQPQQQQQPPAFDVDGLLDGLDSEDLPPDPLRYWARIEGEKTFLAKTLADDIVGVGPLAVGGDDLLWSYAGGVWSPARHVARDRAAKLMGELFRNSHARNAETLIRAYAPRIACEPIGELVNFRNGLLDWRSGELRSHTPDVLSTVQLPVNYNPDATCPAFDRFLAEVVPADMIDIVWELIGYLVFSGNPLHKAVMLMGGGNNGKGTFLHVLEKLLGGKRNITAVSLHDLVNTRFSTASLYGKLANIAGDIDGSYLESTATFKAITGGDTVSAEHKGRDRFDFTPWAVPVFSANKIPSSADTTVGYFRRWLVLPFPHDFTGREDRNLDHRLSTPAELEGIAAKAIAALPRLLDRGDFELGESANAAREEFARRVDQVRTWIDECCKVTDAAPWRNRTELYTHYKNWAQRDGHKAVRASEFYDRLGHVAGVVAARGGPSSVRGYAGIEVLDTVFGVYP